MIAFRCDGQCGKLVDTKVPDDWKKIYVIAPNDMMPNSAPLLYCPECWNARLALTLTGEGVKTFIHRDGLQHFQDEAMAWAEQCFGPLGTNWKGTKERAHRFFEEAAELCQALDMPCGDAHQIVDYVYNRKIGEPMQEVGGVMVTLAVLCGVVGLNLNKASWEEAARCHLAIEKIRAKQAAKRSDSALPGWADEPATKEEIEDVKRRWGEASGPGKTKSRVWPQDFTERCYCRGISLLGHFKGSDVCIYFWDENAGWGTRQVLTKERVDEVKQILGIHPAEDLSSAEFPKEPPRVDTVEHHADKPAERVYAVHPSNAFELYDSMRGVPEFKIPADTTPAMFFGAALLCVAGLLESSVFEVHVDPKVSTVVRRFANKIRDFVVRLGGG